MKIAFALPQTNQIEVLYKQGGVLYRKLMPNPKDNGNLAIKLWREKRIEMKQVVEVRAFVPNVRPN